MGFSVVYRPMYKYNLWTTNILPVVDTSFIDLSLEKQFSSDETDEQIVGA